MLVEVNLYSPKISIGITTYNRPELLREAVDSVLNQSYQNFELIISNDYVDTKLTLHDLGVTEDSRIRIINQPSNLGEINNMNYLLREASGDFFTWLADDDLLHQDFLSSAVSGMELFRNSNPTAFYSNYSSIKSDVFHSVTDGEIREDRSEIIVNVFYDDKSLIENYLKRNLALIGCYGVISIEALRAVGGITRMGSSFGPYSDTVLPVNIVKSGGGIVYTPKKMVFLRLHDESVSSTSTNILAYTSAEADFLEILKNTESIKAGRINKNDSIKNLLRWFSDNNWAVLFRNPDISNCRKLLIYIHHQFTMGFKNLPFHMAVQHETYCCFFLFKFYCRKIVSLISDLWGELRSSNIGCGKIKD